MRRYLLIPLLVVGLVVGAASSGGAAAAQRASTCSDSWGSDGHPGPWYVGSNQSLHGNTLVIGGANCTPGYSWVVTYTVHKTDGSGNDFTPITVVRRGNGPASWSVSTSPVGCNPGWLYYTQVYNGVTGNYIRKPNAGLVIC